MKRPAAAPPLLLAGRLALAVLVPLVAACTSVDGPAARPAPEAPTTTTTGAATGSTAALAGASTSPTSVPAGADDTYLIGVRAATHAGFDRVVFELEGGSPGFAARYVSDSVHEDGSGRPVQLEGSAALEVRMEPAATARVSGDGVALTYRGPYRIRPQTSNVVEVVRTGDFEGVVTWVVATRARTPFKAYALSAPHRIVVDVAHQG